MKRINKNLVVIILAVIALNSCDDVLEEDITNDTIQPIFPTAGTIINGNTVAFSWQQLDGADEYRLQVTNNSNVSVLDSLVSSSSFSYVLNPDNYKWRIKGVNFAYETAYTFPIDFSVEASNDLTSQTVVLQTPSVGLYTNSANIIFTWDEIANINSYSFELIKTFNGEETIIQENDITSTTFAVDSSLFDEDSEYLWKVKAVNSSSQTVYSERNFYLDRVTPNQPGLVSPSDQVILDSTTVTFNWTNGTDTGNVQSEISNTIEISTDINFNSVLNSTTTVNNTYQYVFASSATYYWRVKAIDEANNSSDYSIVRSLEIQ